MSILTRNRRKKSSVIERIRYRVCLIIDVCLHLLKLLGFSMQQKGLANNINKGSQFATQSQNLVWLCDIVEFKNLGQSQSWTVNRILRLCRIFRWLHNTRLSNACQETVVCRKFKLKRKLRLASNNKHKAVSTWHSQQCQ